MKRPLVAIAVAYCAGLLLGAQEWFSHPLPALATAVLLLGASTTFRMDRRCAAAFICLAFVAGGAAYWHARDALLHSRAPSPVLIEQASTNALTVVQGRVAQPNLALPGQRYRWFLLDVTHVTSTEGSTPAHGRLAVRGDVDGALFTGDVVRVMGKPSVALARVNPGLYNSEDYLRRQGVHLAMAVRGPTAVQVTAPGPPWRPQRLIERFRAREAAVLARIVPERALPFLFAVWLGERSRVTDETYEGFVRTGTAHVLAVSGVHIGLVGMSLLLLLRVFTRRPAVYVPVTIAVLFLFALFAGGRISSLRAATMLSLYLTSDLLRRERDAPNALAAAALLFLLLSPTLLFQGGFQLSFLSVASIMLFAEPLAGLIPWGGPRLRQALAVPVAVQVLPLPIVLRLFFVLPLAGPLLNLIVVPLLSVVLWLALLACMTGLVFEPLGLLFGHALAPFVYLIEWVVAWGARLPGAHAVVGPPSVAALVFYGASAGLVWRAGARLGRIRGKTAALAAAASLAAAVWLWQPSALPAEVVFLDVGHGDAIFVRSPEGATLLVDGGARDQRVDYGRTVAAPFLLGRHARRLDYALATHAHLDHMGGLISVVEQLPVKTVLLGPRGAPADLEDELIEICRRRGVTVRRVERGERLDLGGMALEVLHPPADWPGSENDRSLVLRLEWDNVRILLTGDVERRAEAVLSASDIAVDVLKAAHHGSGTSSTPAFLDAAAAHTAVVSTAGSWGRQAMDPAVLGRLDARGMRVFRTDLDGAVSFQLRGEGQIEATAERRRRRYVPWLQ